MILPAKQEQGHWMMNDIIVYKVSATQSYYKGS